jgi:dihydropteroate synthase
MVGDPTGEAKRESGRLAQKTWTPQKRSECSKKAYQTMLIRNSGMVFRGESWKKNVSDAAKRNIAENRSKRISPDTLILYDSVFEFKYKNSKEVINQSDFSDFVQTSKHLCSVFGLNVKESEHKKFLVFVKGKRKSFHGIVLNKVISSQAVEGTGSTEGSTTRQ